MVYEVLEKKINLKILMSINCFLNFYGGAPAAKN
jgi:hypothetical protein